MRRGQGIDGGRRAVWVLLAFVVLGCAGERSGAGAEVVVGSKAFTESVILGEAAESLLADAGYSVEHRAELGGTRVLWSALRRGDIDVYPEYTGTIDAEIFPGRELVAGGGSGRRSTGEMGRALAELGVQMSEPLGFQNTYALGMDADRAEALGIEAISDLVAHPELRLGFSNEFMDREDGWPGLRARYELPHEEVEGLEHHLAYRGLESGAIDVIDLYSTDAEIAYHDLRVLEDDRDFFPDYRAVWLYRSDLSARAPGAVEALARLEGRIDVAAMRRMNEAVKIEGRSEAEVARGYVRRHTDASPGASGQGGGADRAAPARIFERTLEHLLMVGVALVAAIAVAIPLGVVAARRRRLGQVVLGATGILQTIPSLALLVLMIPLLGIGTWPAIAALFLYGLLPIVRNTHAGLTDIPDEIVESARALGLPDGAILRTVELPLALRSILAGIKTSAVIAVGTATLGALVGAGGYGQPILTGIRLDDTGLILEGALPAAGLALLAQGLFDGIERLVVPAPLQG